MLNKCFLIGNLGDSVSLRYTQKGTEIANFNIATSEKWKNQAGDWETRTEWHKILAWGKLGKICGEFLHKGSKVYIEGKLQTQKWDDKGGVTHYTTSIIANTMLMLDNKGDRQEKPFEPPMPEQKEEDMGEVPF